MKAAVLGCGGMGRVHAAALAEMDGVELAGVCDQDAGLAEELADSVHTRAFVSFEEMVRKTAPDVVSITLPSHLHKEYALKAADLGIHIICEKPIALSPDDARAVAESCERKGVRLFVGHVVRFFPEYAQMKKTVEEGKLGRIGVAHFRRVGSHPGEVRPWFKDEARSGGIILDLMIHDIDFARWTLGEARSVYCMRRTEERLDYALATLVFESGAVANLEAYWGYPGPFRTAAEIAGSDGVIRSDSAAASSVQIRTAADAAKGEASPFVEIPQSPLYVSPYTEELTHFIACIRDGREPLVTAHDACKALEIAEAARKSANTGLVVQLEKGG